MTLEVTEESLNRNTLIMLKGRLDTGNYRQLEERLQTTFSSEGVTVIMDCSGLNYVSSSGLRVFLTFLKKSKETNSKFVICDLPPSIEEIFKISGFTNIFEIYTTAAEAQKHI